MFENPYMLCGVARGLGNRTGVALDFMEFRKQDKVQDKVLSSQDKHVLSNT